MCVIFSSSTGYLSTILLLPLLLPIFFKTYAYAGFNNGRENVNSMPFITLIEQPVKLHLVKDYFSMVQHLNLNVVVSHIDNVQKGKTKVKSKYLLVNGTQAEDFEQLEGKLNGIVKDTLDVVQVGLRFLPHKDQCAVKQYKETAVSISNRTKRSTGDDGTEGPIDTWSVLPFIGRWNHYFTGSLDDRAGKVINQNVKNIGTLTKVGLHYNNVLNATARIQRSHSRQIKRLEKLEQDTETKLEGRIHVIEAKETYQVFLQNQAEAVNNIRHWVESIFAQTDAVENDSVGPLSRDRRFMTAINKLMGSNRHKKNSLYLLKLSATADVEACNSQVSIKYKFPLLESRNFQPFSVVSIPKEIKNKFFELDTVPAVVAWSDRVYSFTEQEYRECKHQGHHVFCEKPRNIETLVDNCIYGLVNKFDWDKLTEICPVRHIQNPQELIRFTDQHMIYFVKESGLVSVVCPNLSKTFSINGSGSVVVPTGCVIYYKQYVSHSMGHVSMRADVFMNMDQDAWKTDLTNIIDKLDVTNIVKVESLWEDTSEDEKFVENELNVTKDILDDIVLTPKQSTAWHLSTTSLLGIIAALVFMLTIFVCRPQSANQCKMVCCSCCERKIQDQEVALEDLRV